MIHALEIDVFGIGIDKVKNHSSLYSFKIAVM